MHICALYFVPYPISLNIIYVTGRGEIIEADDEDFLLLDTIDRLQREVEERADADDNDDD
jgi:hypothetical protein